VERTNQLLLNYSRYGSYFYLRRHDSGTNQPSDHRVSVAISPERKCNHSIPSNPVVKNVRSSTSIHPMRIHRTVRTVHLLSPALQLSVTDSTATTHGHSKMKNTFG